MYLVRRLSKTEQVEYYKYDGWTEVQPPLDLSNCVLFTRTERELNTLQPNEEWVWYGSYKR